MNNSITKAIASALIGGACLLASTSSWGVQTVNLRAEKFNKTLSGSTVEMWGFAQDAAAPTVPGPAITIAPGETDLDIVLVNNLTVPISLVIPGQDGFVRDAAHSTFNDAQGRTRARSFVKETPANGGTRTYSWRGLLPGTYIYHSSSHPALQVQMGLYGMLKKNAAAGQAYTGVDYDSEVVWFFSELDLDVHAAVKAGTYGTTIKSMIHSTPEVFLLNGEPYEAGQLPIGAGEVGQPKLLRLLNTCYDERILVLLGHHLSVVAEDGREYPYPKVESGIRLPSLKTRDALLVPNQEGTLAFFDRRYLRRTALSTTPPTPISPQGAGISATPNYTFSPVGGAAGYQIYLWNYSTASASITPAQAGVADGLGNLTIAQTTPLTPGTYTWYVRAVNAAEVGPWSTYMNFTVGTPPAAPTSISPNGAGVSPTAPFTFNTVAGATDYQVWLLDQTAGTSGYIGWVDAATVDPGSTGTGTIAQPTALVDNHSYYWVIRARNTAGPGPWSSGKYFFVGAVPAAPTSISPTGAGVSPTAPFTFNTVAGATDYQVWLADQTAGTSVYIGWVDAATVDPGSTGTGTIAQPTALVDNHSYYWVIRARNAAGPGPWSSGKYFFVGAVPAAPTPISPTGAGVSPTAPFTFNTVAGATDYQVFLFDQTAGTWGYIGWVDATTVDPGSTGTGSIAQPTALVNNHTYYWVIRARNGAAVGSWSSSRVFTTTP